MNRDISRLILCSLALLLAASPRPGGASLSDFVCHDEAASAFSTSDELPALSAALAVDGRLVWSQTLGNAVRSPATPATRRTRFRTGSISKALTSYALGLLVQEGTLDLDAAVQRYVPEFPVKSSPISTRLAAGHLSGLPHYEDRDFLNTTHYTSVVQALDKFEERPQVHPSGQQHLYSSYGWNLVGAVMERASGVDFLELMAKRVFEPLELENTTPELPGEPDPLQARPYARINGLVITPPRIDNSDAWPSAGFLSTAEDLVSFGDAVRQAKGLDEATRDLLWARQTTSAGDETSYGLGWEHALKGGRGAIGHGGSHVGATAGLWILPTENLVVAALTNINTRGLSQFIDELIECQLGPPPDAP